MSHQPGLATRIIRKCAFYAQKLPRDLGLKHRFNTQVGPMNLPKAAISSNIFFHLINRDYEAPELALLDQYLSPDDRIIELGAGIGFLANRYAQYCPNQEHLAIEASPIMADVIRTNTDNLKNLTVINALATKQNTATENRPTKANDAINVNDTPESIDFYIYSDFWASSTLPIHLTNRNRKLVKTIQVPTLDLDKLIHQHQATLLICDIEGGESDLLQMFELNVPKILMELHWRELGMESSVSILKALQSRGYKLFGTPDVLMAIK
jgi:FkbM family methyltransferase